ncbi:MAG: Ig-like domain-containing protein [Rubrivivax sp.]|nr:Ig-like domain-containing protein [Rubrivivax sp.]
MQMIRRLFLALAVSGLAACGGGGSSTSPFGGPAPVTPPPVTGPGTSASDLILVASATQLPNTASSVINLTVTAVDTSRVVVAGAAVSLSADAEGVVTQSATSTDPTGKVTGTLSIGGNRANRVITVTARSGEVTRTAQIQVVGTTITSTLVPAVVAPGAAGQVQYRVVDQTGNPMVGQAVSISVPGTPGLAPTPPLSATAVTGSNGEFTFNYTAPTVTGSYEVAATIAGLTDTRRVTVQSAATVPEVTLVISSASVSANPSVVGVNLAGSSSSRSEIRALFLTSGNRPVPDVRVRFDLDSDVNTIGGSFSTSSAILYSDANGVVTTAYVPSSRSSPTNGLTVRACYGRSDTDPGLLSCSQNARVRLTVVSEPLGVSIGTNELIVVSELSYTKRFLVSVADSAGNAKADVPLSASVDLPQFRKGAYIVSGPRWVKVLDSTCGNEDGNRNGVLEAGEDRDIDGRLEPGRSDVTVRLVNPRTGPDGTAILEITYAKNFATWVDAWITVSASGVAGTEGRATFKFDPVPGDAAAFTNVTVPPAFVVSPYGVTASCTDPN